MAIIEPYHSMHMQTLVFHSTRREQAKHERTQKPTLYLGVELEVECVQNGIDERSTIRKQAADAVFDSLPVYRNYVHLESDGSVPTGFEIITHPMSLDWYHQQGHTWFESMFEKLNEHNRFRSHDTETCGMHIHFSRQYLPERDETKVGFFIYSQPALVQDLARRWDVYYAKAKHPNDIQKQQVDSNHDRRHAVNYENDKTIEIRIFKGTLKYDTFLACLEFVHAVVEYCQLVRIYILADKRKSLEHFLSFLDSKKEYEALRRYLAGKGHSFENLPRFNHDDEHQPDERTMRRIAKAAEARKAKVEAKRLADLEAARLLGNVPVQEQTEGQFTETAPLS